MYFATLLALDMYAGFLSINDERISPLSSAQLNTFFQSSKLDIIIGEGPAARTIKIDLPKFTLVGATTRLGLLSNPLRDRFGIPLKLNFYSYDELQKIVERDCSILNIPISKEGGGSGKYYCEQTVFYNPAVVGNLTASCVYNNGLLDIRMNVGGYIGNNNSCRRIIYYPNK